MRRQEAVPAGGGLDVVVAAALLPVGVDPVGVRHLAEDVGRRPDHEADGLVGALDVEAVLVVKVRVLVGGIVAGRVREVPAISRIDQHLIGLVGLPLEQ